MTYYITHTIFLWILITLTHRYLVNLITFIPNKAKAFQWDYQNNPDVADYLGASAIWVAIIFGINAVAYIPYVWVLCIIITIGFKYRVAVLTWLNKISQFGKQ